MFLLHPAFGSDNNNSANKSDDADHRKRECGLNSNTGLPRRPRLCYRRLLSVKARLNRSPGIALRCELRYLQRQAMTGAKAREPIAARRTVKQVIFDSLDLFRRK